MSTTFSAVADQIARVFLLTCEVAGVLGEWTGYENAYGEAYAHALVCTDSLCAGYGADVDDVTPGVPADVNIGRGNDAMVLSALGFPSEMDDDLSGSATAEDFLGRVLLALAVSPVDEGMPAHAMQNGEGVFGGGRQWHCGREAGYLQRRLEELRVLAEGCRVGGFEITWG